MASIPRSWYLSQARALENKVDIPHMVLPSVEQILNAQPGTYVNMMRVRIDPEKSLDTDKVITFAFTDVEGDSVYGLHVRRGIAEYISKPADYDRSPDVTIELSRESFAKYFTGGLSLEQLLASELVSVSGSEQEAVELLSQFDQYDPANQQFKFHKKEVD
jgi:alkyl sulfatase BDS1-like metallo-beta-lactamase superfamily hydrolase